MIIAFTVRGWNDYLHWQTTNPGIVLRINELINAIQREPFKGVGKPEPLKAVLHGSWSRRISGEHRLVYKVSGIGDLQEMKIVACRYHYEKITN